MEYDNSGALFKNDRKEIPKHPDYKGNATINGEQYWLAAWIKEGKSGSKFMSLAFTLKDEQSQIEPEGDDIPF